jgi:hypothetical protein
MPMSDNADVFLVEDNRGFGQEVEQWALEYTSKFVNAAGPEFHSTTIGQILGTEYVKKNLPEVSHLTNHKLVPLITSIV